MSVGAFLVDQVLAVWGFASSRQPLETSRGLDVGAALALGLLGLGASVFHLGRPWLAYRAIIGWRTSWLSREVIAFGAFAAFAVVYAALVGWASVSGAHIAILQRSVGGMVVLCGLSGIFCSAMIYVSTRRVYWNGGYTGPKFFLTCVVLGAAVVLLTHSIGGAWVDRGPTLSTPDRFLCVGLAIAAGAKLLAEVSIFAWLGAKTFTPLRRTAMLMTGVLGRVTFIRFCTGSLGGVVAPLLLLLIASAEPLSSAMFLLAAVVILALNLVGEFLERYLFFSAVVAPKMPGAPAT
jgi:DMSO reductase anchor subunit